MKYQIKDRAGHKELWILETTGSQKHAVWTFVARRQTAKELLLLINK